MKKIVIILYGPPGGGKGTQARLVGDRYGVVHIDTGQVLEEIVHDPKRQKNKIIQRERILWDSGKLCTTSFVTRMMLERTEHYANAGVGIILSGSPRTIYEAERLLPALAKQYGKKNIYSIVLQVPNQVSRVRNTHRLICKVCKHPFLAAFSSVKSPKHCLLCGGPLYKRTVDNPNVIATRFEQYQERTKPIFEFMKKAGYPLHHMDALGSPAQVFERITAHIREQKGW